MRCPTDGEALQPLTEDPLVGTTFADRYILEECVGEGGMGRVYRARHTRVNRLFAIKVLFGDLAADVRSQKRFAQEADAAARLSHRNVVSVLDFGENDRRQLYLVMDYVEGPSLARLIAEQAPFEANRAANLLRQLAAGLGHAHKRGLVHRAFKPENIIVAAHDDDGELPKILDFGLARIADIGHDKSLTTDGQVMGTPAYMSPEHATASGIDARTDLFSLGVVLYEMLAGVLPFEGGKAELIHQNIAATPPRIGDRVPGLVVDTELEAIAFKLMAKKPAQRYQDHKQVLQAIAEHPNLVPEVRQRALSLELAASAENHSNPSIRLRSDEGSADTLPATEPARVQPARDAAAAVGEAAPVGPRLPTSPGDNRPDTTTPADLAMATTALGPRPVVAGGLDVPPDEPGELEQPGRRWWLLAPVLAVVGVAIWLITASGPKADPSEQSARSSATSSASRSPSSSSTDSVGPSAASAGGPTDAGVADAATAPSDAAGADAKGASETSAHQARPKKTRPKKTRSKAVSDAQFLKRYGAVSARVNRFLRDHGDSPTGRRAKALWSSVDYAKARHDADYRGRAYKILGRLSRMLDRAK